MRCFANLRRDRLVHTMFYEVAENLDNFARVPARELSSENEAALEALLEALARDIEANPERLMPVATELVARIKALVDGCDVDLSAPLPPDP
ncbi:type II toxin-antitoxin system PrlF family antitoxin [Pseudomonas sp. J452]|uniref:type II toxin-antitoxin system PrlF family antitoxin n=1 Tax=Pseudomonas sp. J452 TaxID=2898441 RepID=UPI0021AD8580|nr:type II toxin-antitoxin system PrlF family antitoxin [Pseudomonas sp. J452]UUY07704.1 type II toxin-antitoxin system PrlF family antitoxin [Pseudomonas sp. J452]